MSKEYAEYSDIIDIHAEQLANDYDLDISEARQKARKGFSKNNSYFDDEDLFDSYDD